MNSSFDKLRTNGGSLATGVAGEELFGKRCFGAGRELTGEPMVGRLSQRRSCSSGCCISTGCDGAFSLVE